VSRRLLTVVVCVVALALPTADAWAAARLKSAKSVTKTVLGSTVTCKKWGPIQVQLKIARTVVNGKVKFKILAISEPTWPQHTVKSVFINTRALPLLEQEVLQLQGAKLETISGATDVSVSFMSSLQAALIAAAKV